MQEADDIERPIGRSMWRGFLCKCPSCGESPIFEKTLYIKARCENCDEDLSHHRADDLPAYLNILIVGHLVVGFAMFMMRYKLLGMWETTFLTGLVCVLFGLILMRPLKGMIVGNQWALRMHGFGDSQHHRQQAE